MNENVKTLIMCYLDGHWIPFQDVDICKAYLLRLKSDFNFDISKVRVFLSTFKEIELDLFNHE